MAEVVDPSTLKRDFRRVHAFEGYPLGDWLDGQVWKLTKGVDFHCKTATMRQYLYRVQNPTGGGLHTSMTEDTLIIQAYWD